MDKMNLDTEIIDRVKKLAAKYDAMGQDIVSYLDGLLYADYLTYWDYIDLEFSILLTISYSVCVLHRID